METEKRTGPVQFLSGGGKVTTAEILLLLKNHA
jgi:hypothetical protein